MVQWNSQQFHFRAAWVWTRPRVRTHEKPCGLRFACCWLRSVGKYELALRRSLHPAARKFQATARKLQIAARRAQRAGRKPQASGRMNFHTCVRGRVHSHAERKRNCWEEVHCAISGNAEKLKYVQLGAACGLRPKYKSNKPTHSYFSC